MDILIDSPTRIRKVSPLQLCLNSDTLIVDCRPSVQYEEGHVKGAISLAFPAILWRRILKQKARPNCLDDFLMCEKQSLKRRHQPDTQVILYDDSTRNLSDCAPGTPLRELCEILSMESSTVFSFLEGKEERHIRLVVQLRMSSIFFYCVFHLHLLSYIAFFFFLSFYILYSLYRSSSIDLSVLLT